jgi:hypothetical protein
MDMGNESSNRQPMRQVFTITERDGKSFWIKIGAAFTNRDGSETVLLDALPVNAKLQIRERETAHKTAKKEERA